MKKYLTVLVFACLGLYGLKKVSENNFITTVFQKEDGSQQALVLPDKTMYAFFSDVTTESNQTIILSDESFLTFKTIKDTIELLNGSFSCVKNMSKNDLWNVYEAFHFFASKQQVQSDQVIKIYTFFVEQCLHDEILFKKMVKKMDHSFLKELCWKHFKQVYKTKQYMHDFTSYVSSLQDDYNYHFLKTNDPLVEILSSSPTLYQFVGYHFPEVKDGTLDLAGLSLTCLDGLQEIYAKERTSITTIILADNHFSRLKEDVFKGFSYLKRISLEGNKLGTLPERIFDAMPSLEEVSLSNNRIMTLPSDIFKKLSKLKRVSLSGNFITKVSEGVFDDLPALVEICLAENSLTLEKADFANLPHLQVIDFTNAQLESIPKGFCTNCPQVRHLALSYNYLSTLPEDFFQEFSELRVIDLGHNSLTTLSENSFSGLSKLRSIELFENKLKELPEGIFRGLSNLKHIYLRDNALRVLPKGIFDGLSQLEVIDLSTNQIETVLSDFFNDLPSLQTLNLSGNALSPEEQKSLEEELKAQNATIDISFSDFGLF